MIFQVSVVLKRTVAMLLVVSPTSFANVPAGLLEAWLVLTSVKYHGNLYILKPLNQRLALTRLRETGPRSLASYVVSLRIEASAAHVYASFAEP